MLLSLKKGNLCFISIFFVLSSNLGISVSEAQVVKWKPDPKVVPPLTYKGLVPGVSTAKQVRAACGEPQHENLWYAYKMLYRSQDSQEGWDAIHLESKDGKNGTLGVIESNSIPKGWETVKKVQGHLGQPEFTLEFQRHSLIDYSHHGLRFVFDLEGSTIGIAHFPHGRTRVHEGQLRHLSLRSKRQGPQKAPSKIGSLGNLQMGGSVVDLTPQDPTWLGHQVKKDDFKVVKNLNARTAVIQKDGKTIAIVGADLFGMSYSEIQPIQSLLKKQGIDHLFLAMSHNHAATDTIGIYGFYPKDYVGYIQKQIVQGVLEAKNNLQPVGRWIASSDELSLKGARVQGLARNARNPGIVDPQLAVMQALSKDGKPIVTFVHFSCHPEGLSRGVKETSPDFPGYLCDALQKKLGGTAIFLNGALGGMVTGDTISRTHSEAEKAGLHLAKEAERILKFAVSPQEFKFSVNVSRFEVPLTNPRLILFMNMSGRRKLHEGRVVTEMAHLRLGDAELVTVPGELLPELSFEILSKMDGYPRMIIGLTNDELGYIVPGYDFRAGSYEESMSVGPAIGPMVKDQAIRLIENQ